MTDNIIMIDRFRPIPADEIYINAQELATRLRGQNGQVHLTAAVCIERLINAGDEFDVATTSMGSVIKRATPDNQQLLRPFLKDLQEQRDHFTATVVVVGIARIAQIAKVSDSEAVRLFPEPFTPPTWEGLIAHVMRPR